MRLILFLLGQTLFVFVNPYKILDDPWQTTGQSGFLTFTDYVGLDTDILITFWSVLGIYTDL